MRFRVRWWTPNESTRWWTPKYRVEIEFVGTIEECRVTAWRWMGLLESGGITTDYIEVRPWA